jgi:transposase
MLPAYVKASIRRKKNDAADAAAICEAVRLTPTTNTEISKCT